MLVHVDAEAVLRSSIVKLFVGMFNGSPGAAYLADLVAAYEDNGHSLLQLAGTLSDNRLFLAIAPATQSLGQFASFFLTPLGLQLNTAAQDFVASRFNAGMSKGQIIYEGGYGEITRRAWPARGMVIDPGIHLYGWTRQQAVAYAMESGNFTPQTAEDLVDRVAAWPGQLTAYDTGGLEIFALRKEAEERLGDAFDIRSFHDRILENGALPLGALREHVEAWIEAEGANTGTGR